MRRGDLVTVAAPGDYGKPRPAVVIQGDVINQATRFMTISARGDPFSHSPINPAKPAIALTLHESGKSSVPGKI